MKNIITILFLLLAFTMNAQIVEVTTSAGAQLINLDEVKYVVTQGSGSVLIYGNRLQQLTVTESLSEVVALAGGSLVTFTDSKDNKLKAVSCGFVSKVIESSGGNAIILTNNIAFSFQATEDLATIQARMQGCSGGAKNTGSDILYVSTEGDANGVKGYMNKPFDPETSLDSSFQNLVYWYFPGVYEIDGTIEKLKQFPKTFWAPNADIRYSGGAEFLFRDDPSTLYDTVNTFKIGRLSIDSAKFILQGVSTGKQVTNIDIGTLYQTNAANSGDFSICDQCIIRIDSAHMEGALTFVQPSEHRSYNLFEFGTLYIEQPAVGNSFIKNGGSGDTTLQIFRVDNLRMKDASHLYYNGFSSRSTTNSTEVFDIGTLWIEDELSLIDTLAQTLRPSGDSPGAKTQYFWTCQKTNDVNNTMKVKIGSGVSSKSIDVRSVGNGNRYEFDLGKVTFTKTKAIQLSGFSSDAATVDIVGKDVTSNACSAISILSADNTSTFRIRGKFTTTRAGQPVIYSQSNLYLEDVDLTNDGTVAAIQAPSAITVYVKGYLRMNSTVYDSDVSFVYLDAQPGIPRGLATANTDASGDITVTIPKMADATYSVSLVPEGTTDYTFTVHTKTTTSFKIRTYEPTTGAALGAGVSVSYNYRAIDY